MLFTLTGSTGLKTIQMESLTPEALDAYRDMVNMITELIAGGCAAYWEMMTLNF